MQVYTGNSVAYTLTEWGLPCSFLQLDIAPQVLTYHFNLTNLLDVNKIKRFLPSLMAATKLNIELANSKVGHFALVFPRLQRGTVDLIYAGDVLGKLQPKSLYLGQDTKNEPVCANLDDLPHLLVAGTTGSGKSVCLNSIITGLCCYNNADKLGLVLIDLKQCEFNVYNGLANLITPIITTEQRAEQTLYWLVNEMENRYNVLANKGLDKNDGTFKTLLVVVDELADLVLQNENCKTLLVRLLQKSRAADIHIIVATQSPRAKLLDGLMLANLPSRICLTCANARESMLVLGHGGAEHLTGKGDAIIKLNNTIEEKRVQIPYINKEQILNLYS